MTLGTRPRTKVFNKKLALNLKEENTLNTYRNLNKFIFNL